MLTPPESENDNHKGKVVWRVKNGYLQLSVAYVKDKSCQVVI